MELETRQKITLGIFTLSNLYDEELESKGWNRKEVALAAKFSSRSDVWSVGVTLFLMIAGHLPYETHEDKKTPLFETLTNKADPVLQSLRPTHKELLSSMLQIDSASRCSATEAILQLNAILDDLNWMKLKTDENPSNFDRVASTKPNQNTNQNM